MKTLRELQTQWNQTYVEWKLKTEQNIKEIAIFVDGAVFPTDEKAERCEEAPRLSQQVLEEINGRMRRAQTAPKIKRRTG